MINTLLLKSLGLFPVLIIVSLIIAPLGFSQSSNSNKNGSSKHIVKEKNNLFIDAEGTNLSSTANGRFQALVRSKKTKKVYKVRLPDEMYNIEEFSLFIDVKKSGK